jgi:quercetin dioxygenase-like cupin family protein
MVTLGLKAKYSVWRSKQMNESDFEAQLRADGYTEIETQNLDPRPFKGRHRHLFAIRGLVLSGTFNVTQDGEPVTFGPGQVFAVAYGELHDESIGAKGARVLIGRKFSTVCRLVELKAKGKYLWRPGSRNM